MPRLSATTADLPEPPPRARPVRRKRPPPRQDRLTARQLLWRRLRRGVKPGLWFLAVLALLAVAQEVLRDVPVPSAPSARAPEFGDVGAELGLRVDNVVIHGAQPADMAALQAAVGVAQGTPLYGVSLAAVRQRVEQYGPVDSAVVERVLPDTLVVTVTVRDAYAIWQTVSSGQTQFVVIDNNGNVISGQDAAEAKRREPWLLLLTGANAPQQAKLLIPALQAQPGIYARVTAAEWVDGLRWNLILKDQTVVKLPADDLPGALAELNNLQASLQLLDRPVEAIDLRLPGKLVVQTYSSPQPPKQEQAK
jgi:cell division protein FtsQ